MVQAREVKPPTESPLVEYARNNDFLQYRLMPGTCQARRPSGLPGSGLPGVNCYDEYVENGGDPHRQPRIGH
jgi:hypothetical protein